jgi:hypothetical protein
MRWLEADHPKRPGLKNRDRQDNDLKNHERALQCFTAAVGDGETDLSKLPLSLLQVSDALVARQVREGARLLAEHSRKAIPGDKTLSNLVSCLKAVRKVALEGLAPRQTVTQVLKGKVKPKRRTRPSFPSDSWPEGLKDEWQGFLAWKTVDFLPSNEERFRKKRVRQTTCKAYLRKTNVYVGWFVRELGRSALTLEDLCDLDNYVAYLNWYLNLEAGGGYASAKETGVTLVTLSQYLVAKGRLSEDHIDGLKIWDAFYARAYKAVELGADRGVIDELKEIGDWKPWHLAELAEAMWNSEPVHSGAVHGQRHRTQLVCRKRTALLFRLGMETPLRIRNWSEMQWGKNLYKNKRGQWIVRFKGEELKVGRRELKTNVYERTYSDEAGKWIERWRRVLEDRLGPDFETQCPYVFPHGNLDRERCAENSLRRQMNGLSLEIYGKPFNPHLLRHIVASHVVNELGPGGLKLAAELLGDTNNVVLNTYYRPNTAEAFQNYLAVCSEKKQKR